jgi:hypothetical protein
MSDSDKLDELNHALKQWRVSAPLPPRFQEKVWQRIESAEDRRRVRLGELIRRWIESIVPRPAVAASYIGTLLVLGFVGGMWQAQEHNARTHQTIERKYVQSIDPYQALREMRR